MSAIGVKDFNGATDSFNTDMKNYIDSKTSDIESELANKLTAEQAAAVGDLGQTISGTYNQAEVQAISDKVDELLGALRTAGIIAT